MAESSSDGWKTLLEKERLLVMSNFFFSHSVLKDLYCRHVKPWLVWKRIKLPFTSLPNDKILHWSELKGFADDKIKVTQKLKNALERVENIVGKGENAGYWHYPLFSTMFTKCFLYRVVKSRDCVIKKPFENIRGKEKILVNE